MNQPNRLTPEQIRLRKIYDRAVMGILDIANDKGEQRFLLEPDMAKQKAKTLVLRLRRLDIAKSDQFWVDVQYYSKGPKVPDNREIVDFFIRNIDKYAIPLKPLGYKNLLSNKSVDISKYKKYPDLVEGIEAMESGKKPPKGFFEKFFKVIGGTDAPTQP